MQILGTPTLILCDPTQKNVTYNLTRRIVYLLTVDIELIVFLSYLKRRVIFFGNCFCDVLSKSVNLLTVSNFPPLKILWRMS